MSDLNSEWYVTSEQIMGVKEKAWSDNLKLHFMYGGLWTCFVS